LSRDEEVAECGVADTLFLGDSRDMSKVPDKSVSLVATSERRTEADETTVATSRE